MPQAPNVKRRIGMRLALMAGGIALGVFLAGLLVLLPIEQKAVRATAEDQVALIAEIAATSFQIIDARTKSHNASEVLSRLGAAPSVRSVSVLNSAGDITWSTDATQKNMHLPLHNEMKYVHQNREDVVVTWQLPFALSCKECHQKQSAPLGAVQVVVKREAVFSKLEAFHLFFALFALLAFIALVLGLAFTAERMVGRPVYKLARLMDKARTGDFKVRARLRREDEIGALAQAFNAMLQAISSLKAAGVAREADLQKAKHKLQLQEQVEKFASQLAESNAALERRVKAQELLMEASHQLASTLDRTELLQGLCELINFVLGWADFAIFLTVAGDDDKAQLFPAAARGLADVPALKEHLIYLDAEKEKGFSAIQQVAESGLPFHVPDVKSWGQDGLEADLLNKEGSFLCIPMLHKGRAVGVMTFLNDNKDVFDDDDLQLLQALAAQAATAVVNADLFEATRALSVKDPLTQLMNRRAMESHLEMELVRAQRFNHPLGVLMIDVDHFKSYNDRLGHLQGDEALKAVANEMRDHVRKVDAVARYGGEEFCVILPRADEAAALEVAEKLARGITELNLKGAKEQPLGFLSISIGVAIYPLDLPDAGENALEKQLLDAADQALFAAKHQGRNQVACASSIQERKPRAKLDEVRLKKKPSLSSILQPDTLDDH